MKHAFLIMAHHQESVLKALLQALDNDRVDIFVHIDKKSTIDINELKKCVHVSNLFFTERVAVSWGGYSAILAEYLLIRDATEKGVYDYYHFLSGQDYLLKPIDKILDEFDGKQENYICFKDEVDAQLDRLKYYYCFQDKIGRNNGIARILQSAIKNIQKLVRFSRELPDEIGFGSAFFDITNDFANYIVEHFDKWQRVFRYTYCADELFIQSMYLEYKRTTACRLSNMCSHDIGTVHRADATINRAIDWKRGNPYVWKADDYRFLRNSNLMFVRKIDETDSSGLMRLLIPVVLSSN